MIFKFTKVKISTPSEIALYRWVKNTLASWAYKPKLLNWDKEVLTKALVRLKKLLIQVAIGHANESGSFSGTFAEIDADFLGEVIKAIKSNKNTESKHVPDDVKSFLKKYFTYVWPSELRMLSMLKTDGLIDEDGSFSDTEKICSVLQKTSYKNFTVPKDEKFDLTL